MEREEFIEIVDKHKGILFKICHIYTSSVEDCKDLEQEIVVQLWQSIDRFDGRVKLSTWIYKVALNRAILYFKRESRRRVSHVNVDSTILTLTTIPDSGEYNRDVDRQIEQLYAIIGEMSKIDKAVILLFLDGYKYREISDLIELSESNVATKISRIKQSIKRSMNP